MIGLMKSQIDATIEMLEDTIGKFDNESWKTGFGTMHYPWRLAWHAVESLDCYFSPGIQFRSGYRFGKPWWEMTDQEAPSIKDMQKYLNDVKAKIEKRVQIDGGREESEKYDPASEVGRNVLEHYVYAIRHTMHHHGALAALAIKAGASGIMWK